MASTRTQTIYKDTLLAKSGSTPVGGGNDEHLPIGVAGSYDCKAALKFNLDFAGVTKVISARLYLKTTTKVHALTWGASPTLVIERQTGGNFTENAGRSSYDSPAGSGWSGSNSDFDSVPNGSNDISWTVRTSTPAESTWYSVDITGIFNQWVPASILLADGVTHGYAQPNYGIDIRPSSYATSETVEFFSRKSGSDPYIVMTYESNIAPTAIVTAPANGARLLSTALTPSIACAFVEANSIASYDVQVATDAAFTALVWDLVGSVAGLAGTAPDWTSTIPYAGTALAPGTVYYVRARATDNEAAVGAWSPTISFRLNRAPTSSGGSAFVARVHNLTDLAIWTLAGSWAKPELKFTPTDLDSDPITGYEVRISLAGTPVSTDSIVGSFASGALIAHLHSYALVNGTLYTVAFRARDASEWGPWTSEINFRVRWGEGTYEAPVPAGSANWRVVFGALDGVGAVMATSYRKATGASGAGATAWSASIPTPLAGAGFINVRIRVASQGTAPTQPSLPDFTFTYDASAALPTGWTFPDAVNAGLETNVRRYGQNSIRMSAKNGAVQAYQDIAVSEDTDYTFSGWAKIEAALVNCTVKVGVYTTAGVLIAEATMASGLAIDDWHRITSTFRTAEGQTTIRFMLQIVGTAGATGLVWFDAAMLDEGTVAGQWTPALVGLPVVIDAQGIIINSTAGGMLRIDGTVIKPAPYVGNDPPVSPSNGQLWWDDDDTTVGPNLGDTGPTFPPSPGIGRRWFRSDFNMEFIWTGVYWLSTQMFPIVGSMEVASATYFVSNSVSVNRWQGANMALPFGTDWFIEYITQVSLVNSGGTALAAGHQWRIDFMKGTISVPTTLIGSITIASGANDVERADKVTVGALLDVTNNPFVTLNVVKTGTPGNLSQHTLFIVYARIMAT